MRASNHSEVGVGPVKNHINHYGGCGSDREMLTTIWSFGNVKRTRRHRSFEHAAKRTLE